jgi:cephalosporin hydroxylase
MVAPGCYFIVEDGIVDVMAWQQHTPGPLVAVQKFLCTNNQFVIDESREKFILTYAPSGFLKRQ